MKTLPMFAKSLALCILASLALGPTAAVAQPSDSEEEKVTVITSDSLLFDYAKQFALFKGNVVVVDPGLRLTGDELTVYFDENDDVERIIAKGNTVIQMEDLNSRSEMATYEVKEGKIVLEGKPQVNRGRSVLQAEEITYWRFENKLIAKPRARVLLFQNQDEGGDGFLN